MRVIRVDRYRRFGARVVRDDCAGEAFGIHERSRGDQVSSPGLRVVGYRDFAFPIRCLTGMGAGICLASNADSRIDLCAIAQHSVSGRVGIERTLSWTWNVQLGAVGGNEKDGNSELRKNGYEYTRRGVGPEDERRS